MLNLNMSLPGMAVRERRVADVAAVEHHFFVNPEDVDAEIVATGEGLFAPVAAERVFARVNPAEVADQIVELEKSRLAKSAALVFEVSIQTIGERSGCQRKLMKIPG